MSIMNRNYISYLQFGLTLFLIKISAQSSLYFKMASQQALALWKSQIPSYQKIINRCCNRIITPLTVFLPSNFQQKIQEFRQSLSIKQPDNYENFVDVIAYYIQGRKNKSTIQLADQFVRELGGDLKYWQIVILDIAQQTIYTPQLSLWHVRKIFQQKLYIDPENLSNYRRLCRLTKVYLNTLNNLIKYIIKFDKKKDTLLKIDELFKKVKSAQQKYIGFSQQIIGLESSNTFNELSNNISQKSKQNALKDLFHFKEPQKNVQNDKVRNTLFNYNFRIKNKQVSWRASEPTKNVRQTNKQLNGERMQAFQKLLKNLKKQKRDIKELQNQFISKKKKTESTDFPTNFVTIWDKDYYFSFLQHPIQMNKFNTFNEPFYKHEWVNYQINSDDQYQDLIGEDVDANSQISSASDVTRNSFVVSDDHFSDDEDVERQNKQTKPQLSNCFGQRWNFNIKQQSNKIKFYQMVLIQSKVKLPLQISQKNQIQEVLFRVVDGKDKESIIQAISKQRIKISKAKIKQFLNKKCKSYVQQNSKKVIYKIIEIQDQNKSVSEKQNISRKSYKEYFLDSQQEQQKNKEQETDFFEENLSQPAPQRMMTRRSKKQSSQKLENSKVSEDKTRNSRNRKSTSHIRKVQNKKSV